MTLPTDEAPLEPLGVASPCTVYKGAGSSASVSAKVNDRLISALSSVTVDLIAGA